MSAGAQFLPLIAVSPLLLYAGLEDLRHLRIPNWLVLGMAAVFVLTAPVAGWEETGLRLLAATAVLLICFVLFCCRVLAGGDVKMMATVMLFVPTSALISFSWSFSLSMIAAVAAVTALQRLSPERFPWPWASVQAPGKLPMGVAISLALLLLPAVSWLTA